MSVLYDEDVTNSLAESADAAPDDSRAVAGRFERFLFDPRRERAFKKIKESTGGALDVCKKADVDTSEDLWLSAAMMCVDAAATLAEEGMMFKRSFVFSPEKFVCAEPSLSFDGRAFADAVTSIDDVDDATKVQRAFSTNVDTFLKGFKPLWSKKYFDVFETIARNTETLRVGQTLLHQTGFTGWDQRDFDEKWNGPYSMWFSPLPDESDAGWKAQKARKLRLSDAQWCAVATRCVPGVLNIDAFEIHASRFVDDGTGFRNFTAKMKSLCEAAFAGETHDPKILTREKCDDVMRDVTSADEGLGRDRRLPEVLQFCFRGWILKQDKSSSLERQIVLSPAGRAACARWRMGELPKNVDRRTASALQRGFRMHLIEPLMRTRDRLVSDKVRWLIEHYHTVFGEAAAGEVLKRMTRSERSAIVRVLANKSPSHSHVRLRKVLIEYGASVRAKTNGSIRLSVRRWLSHDWAVFTSTGDPDHISNWDVSQVTDMRDLFQSAMRFNEDLSRWNVSHVTDMSGMFRGAFSFDRDLSAWDVSEVVLMSGMFRNAKAFKGIGLSNWKVSNVIDTRGMFEGAETFDQDLSKWNVSRVKNIDGMFRNAKAFRGVGVTGWDMSRVETIEGMFDGAETFDQDLSKWNVSGVKNMSGMFRNAKAFKGVGVSKWDVSEVETINGMFDGAETFDQDLSRWNLSNVTDMYSMFSNAKAFGGTGLSGWNVSNVTDMAGMFSGAETFDQDLSTWNVSRVNNMSYMFRFTKAFKGVGVSGWDVSEVKAMVRMFAHTETFDQDLSGWNVSKVESMSGMFSHAKTFNNGGVPLNFGFNTERLMTINEMFRAAKSFNQDVSGWLIVGPQIASIETVELFDGADAFDNAGKPFRWFFRNENLRDMVALHLSPWARLRRVTLDFKLV